MCAYSGHVALNNGVTGYHDIWHAMLQVRKGGVGKVPSKTSAYRKVPECRHVGGVVDGGSGLIIHAGRALYAAAS